MKLRAALHRGVDTVASTARPTGLNAQMERLSRAYPIEMMKLRPVLVKAIDEASDDTVASELEQLLAMQMRGSDPFTNGPSSTSMNKPLRNPVGPLRR